MVIEVLDESSSSECLFGSKSLHCDCPQEGLNLLEPRALPMGSAHSNPILRHDHNPMNPSITATLALIQTLTQP